MSHLLLKIGGEILDRAGAVEEFAQDVAALVKDGWEVVIVHGGGASLTRALDEAGIPAVFHQGLRITPIEALPIVERVFCREINARLVEGLRTQGLRAEGVSGARNRWFTAERWNPEGTDLGHVGRVAEVHVDAFRKGEVVVLPPMGTDKTGALLNINGDDVASAVAEALKVDCACYLSAVGGILRNGSLVSQATPGDLEAWLADGTISGGMIPKARAILRSLARDVGQVSIVGWNGAGTLCRHLTECTGGTRIHYPQFSQINTD